MSRQRKSSYFLFAIAMLGITSLTLSGCVAPLSPADFHQLPGGSFDNAGAVIEEPGVFRIVGGQPYNTPFSIDCTQLTADVNGWQAAVAAGAHKVAITLPGQRRQYGGVLAFCKIHKSATGPSSRSYDLVIPEGKISEASDGLIASVAEQVSVQRPPAMTVASSLNSAQGQGVAQALAGGQSLGQALLSGAAQGAATPQGMVTDDFAWMLWFSDHPDALGVSFVASPVDRGPAPPAEPMPKLTKGASYTLTKGLSLHSGPGQNASVLTKLSAGDTVVASGESKGSYWSVTTVGGQTGWVSARSLKPN